ncbi:hypothetical protein PAHAL_9G614000 [Panicum hallii]|uniref:Uncharacterized protein n=1 Tax=Panicum hallii TaxID=206008 RepID=A0A2S3IUH6_9POAL|nr:hypothetical protein PAHAL_9G614000 [Panicum hallii]
MYTIQAWRLLAKRITGPRCKISHGAPSNLIPCLFIDGKCGEEINHPWFSLRWFCSLRINPLADGAARELEVP